MSKWWAFLFEWSKQLLKAKAWQFLLTGNSFFSPFSSLYDSIYSLLVLFTVALIGHGLEARFRLLYLLCSEHSSPKWFISYCTIKHQEMNYTNLTVFQASPSSLEYCFSKWSKTTLQICFASFLSDFAFSYDDKKKLLTHPIKLQHCLSLRTLF